jgi:hypothetical protein
MPRIVGEHVDDSSLFSFSFFLSSPPHVIFFEMCVCSMILLDAWIPNNGKFAAQTLSRKEKVKNLIL